MTTMANAWPGDRRLAAWVKRRGAADRRLRSLELLARSAPPVAGHAVQASVSHQQLTDDQPIAAEFELRQPSASVRLEPPSHLPSAVQSVLRSTSSRLAPELRVEMEARLGTDLAAVQLHVGPEAAASAASINAEAYTFGSHVVLGQALDLGSRRSRALLAHELAHAAQQCNATAASPGLTASASQEGEADRAGHGNAVRVTPAAAAIVARQQSRPSPADLTDEQLEAEYYALVESLSARGLSDPDSEEKRRQLQAIESVIEHRLPGLRPVPPAGSGADLARQLAERSTKSPPTAA